MKVRALIFGNLEEGIFQPHDNVPGTIARIVFCQNALLIFKSDIPQTIRC